MVSAPSIWNQRCHIITVFLKGPKCNSCTFALTHSMWTTSKFPNIIFPWQSIFFYSIDVKANEGNQGMHTFFNCFCSLVNWSYSIYSVSTQCKLQGMFLSTGNRKQSRGWNTRLDPDCMVYEKTTTIHSIARSPTVLMIACQLKSCSSNPKYFYHRQQN